MRTASMSPIGRFSIALPLQLPPPPVVSETVACTEPSNRLSLGCAVTTLTVPPIELEP